MKNKISIITVTKNSKDYIEETIESVICQYNKNSNFELEYLIHDGNSTDGTNEIILEYAKKYNFIKFSSFQDTGLYDGLAYCINKSSGDLTAYINSGDFYYKKSFEIINNIFSKNKNIKWLMGSKFFYNDDSEIIDFSKPFKYRRNLIQAGVYGKYLPFIQQESTFWRSSLNKLINLDNLKNMKLSGDYYMWYCFSKVSELHIVNSYLSGFKYHKNQLTFKETGNTDKYIEEVDKFKNKLKIKDIIHIILDAPIWYILKNLQKYLSTNSRNHINFNIENANWSLNKFKNIFCWVTELNSNQGEGILGSMYMKSILKYNNNIEINSYDSKFTSNSLIDFEKKLKIDKNLNKSFFHKYLVPLIGIFYCWVAFFKKKKVIYVNYIPLWNILIFMLCPPKTIFGPITGAIFKGKASNTEEFLRKYFLPILYQISLLFLKFRKKKKLIFSTENLKNILDSNIKEKSKFNFFLNNFENVNESETQKEIDILFYYRIYSSKNSNFLKSLADKFAETYKVYIVGDYLDNKKLHNLGKIERNQLKSILKNKIHCSLK